MHQGNSRRAAGLPQPSQYRRDHSSRLGDRVLARVEQDDRVRIPETCEQLLGFPYARAKPTTSSLEQMPVSVLIVDDDPTFRALARRLLTAAGLVVVGEAENVAEGLSMANELKPNAVLVDVGLPDGDGFGLSRQLTALPWRPRVVLTSVEADIGSDGAVRGAGAEAFVHKADLPNAPLEQLLGGR